MRWRTPPLLAPVFTSNAVLAFVAAATIPQDRKNEAYNDAILLRNPGMSTWFEPSRTFVTAGAGVARVARCSLLRQRFVAGLESGAMDTSDCGVIIARAHVLSSRRQPRATNLNSRATWCDCIVALGRARMRTRLVHGQRQTQSSTGNLDISTCIIPPRQNKE